MEQVEWWDIIDMVSCGSRAAYLLWRHIRDLSMLQSFFGTHCSHRWTRCPLQGSLVLKNPIFENPGNLYRDTHALGRRVDSFCRFMPWTYPRHVMHFQCHGRHLSTSFHVLFSCHGLHLSISCHASFYAMHGMHLFLSSHALFHAMSCTFLCHGMHFSMSWYAPFHVMECTFPCHVFAPFHVMSCTFPAHGMHLSMSCVECMECMGGWRV